MLSRVADSIYWLNRYVERSENVARFVDVNLNLMLDLPAGVEQQWRPLVVTTGDLDRFEKSYGEATAENVVRFLTFDRDYPNSILSCIRFARENARSVREIISSEMWEDLNSFYLFVTDTESQLQENPSLMDSSEFLHKFFRIVKLASHRFCGIMDATMSHNEGWHFGQMGRLLERADKTARIFDVKYYILLPSAHWVGTPLDQIQWMALLKSASAYEMYRKCQHRIVPSCVADFLIFNREFPRSIYFCIRQVEQSLHQVTGIPAGTWSTSAERALGRMSSRLGYTTIEDVIEIGLHEFLDRTQLELNQVGNEITSVFFQTYSVS